MDLIPSIDPDADVPDFEDGDDEVDLQTSMFEVKKADAKTAPKPAKKSKTAVKAAAVEEGSDADEVVESKPAKKPQAAWSFKDTIAHIDATSNRTAGSSLQDKIAAVLKKREKAKARAAAAAAAASTAASAAPSASKKADNKAGAKRKRGHESSDDEIEEIVYEDEDDGSAGSDDDDEASGAEDEEGDDDGSDDEEDDEEDAGSADDDDEAMDEDGSDADVATEADDDDGSADSGSSDEDADGAQDGNDDDADGSDGGAQDDDDEEDGGADIDALLASAKPNPHRVKSNAGDSRNADGALSREYSKFFAPDPFSESAAKKRAKAAARAAAGGSSAADADGDRLRELQAGSKLGKDKGSAGQGQAGQAEAGSSGAKDGAGAGGAAAVAALPATEPKAWPELNLSRPLLKAVQALGYTSPTPIQRRTVPLALAGHDVCGSAVTGSGKTAAYLLPILERLLYRPSRVAAIRVLILVPTRELAAQVHSMASQLAQFCTNPPIRACLVVGGVSLQAQSTELRGRPDIVVATPGRMLDHIRNSMAVHTDDVDVLVLDEADRLLEMGFEAEVQEIVKSCPVGRQTLLFSATMTTRVESLIKLSLRKPVRVTTDPLYDMANRLVQEFVRMRPGKDRDEDREALVLSLITRSFNTGGVLVFTTHKREAHRLAILLGLAGVKAAELHGNLTQRQRLSALEDFRTGSADVLVATDLAGRGLDIAGVRVVLNAHMPREMTAYVHRVGRTARAGRGGVAVSLVSDDSRALMREIVKRAALNVRSRAVPADVVSAWRKQVDDWEDAIHDVLAAERDERELRLAEMEVTKASNLVEHDDEIKSRPARSWFQSEKEKQSIREASKAVAFGRAKDGSAADSDEEGAGAGASSGTTALPRFAGERGSAALAAKTGKHLGKDGKEVDGHRMNRKKRRRMEALAAVDAEAKRVDRLQAQADRERKAQAGVDDDDDDDDEGQARGHKDRHGQKGKGKDKGKSAGSGGNEDAALRKARKRVEATALATHSQHLLARRAKKSLREAQQKTGMTARRVAKMMLGSKDKSKKKRRAGDGGEGGAGGGSFSSERKSAGGSGGAGGGGRSFGGKPNKSHKPGIGSKARHKKRR